MKNNSKDKLLMCLVVALALGILIGIFLRKTCVSKNEGVNFGTPVSGNAVSGEAITPVSGSSVSDDVVSGDAVSVEPTTTFVVSKEDESPATKVVKYNTDKVKKALQKKSYIEIRQILQTKLFNEDKTEGNSTESENFLIKYDTKSKISKLNMRLDFGTGLGNGNVRVINDFKHNKHYTKENGKKWVRNKKNTVVLNLDHKKIKSAYDVYVQLLKDYTPKNGKKGTLVNGLEIYRTKGKVNKKDVEGCQYDELLNKEIIVTLKKKLPLSVSKVVNFKFGGKTYQITTTIDIKELSNKKLKITEMSKKKHKSKKR